MSIFDGNIHCDGIMGMNNDVKYRKYLHLKVHQRMNSQAFKTWLKEQPAYISGDALSAFFGEFVEVDRTCLSIPTRDGGIVLTLWFQLLGGACGDEGIDKEALTQLTLWADRMLREIPEASESYRSMDFGSWKKEGLDRLEFKSDKLWEQAINEVFGNEAEEAEARAQAQAQENLTKDWSSDVAWYEEEE